MVGANGMLGHKLVQEFAPRFETWATVRRKAASMIQYCLCDPARVLGDIDATDFDSVVAAVTTARPSVVINALGMVKQRSEARDPMLSIAINALFPHRLAKLCCSGGMRLIHISSDCVFSGKRGMYSEGDSVDPEDLYGQTKVQGEVSERGCLTVRSSVIGRQLSGAYGLLEWFLSRKRGSTVHGYTEALFSGLTTSAFARILAEVIEQHPDLTGLYHIASEPISKFALLEMLRDAYRVDVRIEPFAGVRINRSLNGMRFREATGLLSPSWSPMVRDLAADQSPYDRWRQIHES